jgi:hypothetical protein
MEETDEMNAEAIATEQWIKNNPDAGNPTSLGAPAKYRQFLENRLTRAFQQGMMKGREIEADEAKRRIIQRLYSN